MTRLPLPLAAAVLLTACGGSAANRPASSASPRVRHAEAISDEGAAEVDAEVTTTTTAAPDRAGAAAVMPAPSHPVAQDVRPAWSEDYDALVTADRDLHDALQLAAIDCASARELRDRICELSARICDLAYDTQDAATRERCADGAARCGRASERVEASCP